MTNPSMAPRSPPGPTIFPLPDRPAWSSLCAATHPGRALGPAIATNKGTISLVRTGFNAATGLYTYNVVVPGNVYVIAFNFTHTKGTVCNIHLIQPGYNPNNYPVYTTAYLDLFKT